ncbi:hypothetical protein KUV47_17480 [Vannielia litorea]|uniref:hypothetical protein n=1 Tax=Vannielia litorea TaxID=1217970 RepID=UPI001C959DC1|nr:hypothetical protein [Vannielia litorea]MBY6155018.1 hypothetical protein [Vannielia litorea]
MTALQPFTREELEPRLRRLVAAEVPEAEEEAYVAELSARILDPQWLDYIYAKEWEHLTLVEACDKILSYRAIRL